MFPIVGALPGAPERFPRVCGDVSCSQKDCLDHHQFSPRMRGCFQAVLNKEIYAQVFPAYAGMFLQFFQLVVKVLRFPRVCGDVSHENGQRPIEESFSPRMRGCFYIKAYYHGDGSVFPAYAGMFLRNEKKGGPERRFPRVCGDVSTG